MVIIPDPRWVNTGLAAQGSWEFLLLFNVFTIWQGVEFKCEVKVQTQECWGRAPIIRIHPQREEQQEGKGGTFLLILPVNKPTTFVLLCCFSERLQDTCTAPSPFFWRKLRWMPWTEKNWSIMDHFLPIWPRSIVASEQKLVGLRC